MGFKKQLVSSLAARLVVVAALWSVAVIIAGGLTLSAIFRETVEQAFDAQLSVRMESLIAATQLGPNGITLSRDLDDSRYDLPYSGWYWQISAQNQGAILRSRSLWDQVLRPGLMALDGGYQVLGDRDTARIRSLSRRVRFPESPFLFFFTMTGSATEIEEKTSKFNKMLFISLGLLAIGLMLSVFFQVYFGLRPLRQLRQQLGTVRSGQSDHLAGSFPSEVQPLADEINSLLEHNATLLERARQHVGNLAHALRTPLTILTNEAAAKRSGLARLVADQSQAMRRHIDHHLAKARAAGQAGRIGQRTSVTKLLQNLRRIMSRLYPDKTFDLDMAYDDLCFRGDKGDLEEILGNIIDNAGKWASSAVDIKVDFDDDRLMISICDDGPGLKKTQRDKVFDRGARLDEQTPGSGLGLSIVRDYVALYGGSIALGKTKNGGLRVDMMLPGLRFDGEV